MFIMYISNGKFFLQKKTYLNRMNETKNNKPVSLMLLNYLF